MQLSMASRVLASADAYRDLVEDRPHRDAVSPEGAAQRLRAATKQGALDADAVSAVLAAAGTTGSARRQRPSDLTARQLEVLRLVARGFSNRAIAERLVISPRTAERHVQDVFAKIGVSSRSGAALFAMEHGLVGQHG